MNTSEPSEEKPTVLMFQPTPLEFIDDERIANWETQRREELGLSNDVRETNPSVSYCSHGDHYYACDMDEV